MIEQKKRRGRPLGSGHQRYNRIGIRLSDAELAVVKLSGMTISQFVRQAIMDMGIVI